MKKSDINANMSDAYRNVKVSMLPVRVALIAISALALGILAWCFFGQMTDKEYFQGVVFPSEGTNGVNIPNSGVVKTLFVHKGDHVVTGQSLALVSVSGAYSIVSAPSDGIVLSFVQENEPFEAFEDIVDLLSNSGSGPVRSVTAFADFNSKRFLAPGQTAQVTPANETRERVGYVNGRVVHVSEYPVSKSEAVLKLQNESLANEIFPDKSSVFEVEIALDADPSDPDALSWSFKSDESLDMSVGTFCNIEVIVKSRNVFRYMMENAREKKNAFRIWLKE